MQNFTPYSALAGGILIGLSAALLLLFNGRRAGVSGILGGLLSPWCSDFGWRFCFIIGLLIGPLLVSRMDWISINIQVNHSLPIMAIAGLLVGYGTSLANGCTSGHGICGLARLSMRSLVATLTFMITGGVTVFIVRHITGLGS